MANCPLQVILNASEYIKDDTTPRRRGNYKDYYEGRDQEFQAHRRDIYTQLDLFADAQAQSTYSKIAYAKVTLEKSAVAKTNRPFNAVITKKNGCSVVGGGKAGEMIVRFAPNSAKNIQDGLSNAEDNTTWTTNKQNKLVSKPSAWRSDVGAINSISAYTAADKCDFSGSDIVDFINEHKSGFIYVELFESPNDEILSGETKAEGKLLFSSFKNGLKRFSGLRVHKSSLHSIKNLYVLSLGDDKVNDVDLNNDIVSSNSIIDNICTNEKSYEELLGFLTSHPAVRRLTISPVIESIPTPSFKFDKTENIDIPESSDIDKYPLVGIADTGVSELFSSWTIARYDNMQDKYKDKQHGSFISGLEVIGGKLNPSICKEQDGCRIVDMCIMPKQGEFASVYRMGIEEFLIVLRTAVADVVESTGLKIINLSMNIRQTRFREEYSGFAKELDDIATTYGVVFVISAGNLIAPRNEWVPDDSDTNINEYKKRLDDIVYSPAESVRNITVGALNPPDNYGLTSYSCRGDGTPVGVKPDVVQVGGFGHYVSGTGSGLYSTTPTGKITTGCGTSYSAPIVAKTLASLDSKIEGITPRETLIALAIHNAEVPEPYMDKKYRPYLKDILGYGVPADSGTILNGSEHSISLVFNSSIKHKQVLSFPFTWPTSLIRNGKYYGKYRLTIVSTPQLDYSFDEEIVREDVQVSLVQIDDDEKRTSRTKLLYSNEKAPESENGLSEEDRKEKFGKWQPVKVYEKEFDGVSLDKGTWRLEVRYQLRENTIPLPDGLPFTMILTISDPDGEAPVYNEMRLSLQNEGVKIADIQTAARIMPRV